MAVTHPTSTRNAIADAVVDSIDVGGAGSLIFMDSSSPGTEVATLTFSVTAFGAASGGTATAASITSDTNATGGTVSQFKIVNGASPQVAAGFAGSVTATTTSPQGDITLTSVAIGAGDTVEMTSLTYSAPA
jgi:hypothetical protein